MSSTAQVIGEFLAGCREPLLSEPGEELFSLKPGTYAFEERQGRLYFQAWDEHRTLARRIAGIESNGRGRLELSVEHFGKRTGSITLLDRMSPANHAVPARSARQALRERFRRMLHRQFGGFRIDGLSSEPDLEHSLSPSYPRALLHRADEAWATIAAPEDPLRVDGVLSFGLIWLDHLRRRERKPIRGLAVFVPEGFEKTTCLRVKHLDPSAAEWAVFSYSEEGGERRIDLADSGNVDTRLEVCGGGSSGGARLPTPESRLEFQVRRDIEALDARLLPEPVYGQTPTFAGRQRGIMDLLAVDRDGHLTLIELKASEDIHLPLQALDYWIRVKWHLDRGEFTPKGYFPGIELRREAPRMLLAAPALQFHPSNETVLRFLAPAIEVNRLGLDAGWRKDTAALTVMFRM